MSTERNPRRASVLLALAMALAPSLVAAQWPSSVRFFARSGLIAPDVYFYEQFINFSGDGPVEWTTGALGRAVVAGLGAELEWADNGVLIRSEVVRSFDTWLAVTHGVVAPRVLFDPPEIINTYLDVPTAVTLTSLQLVLPTRLRLRGLQPFVFGGVGGKFYRFGDPTRPNEVAAILPSDGFTWGVDLGAGLEATLFGLSFDV